MKKLFNVTIGGYYLCSMVLGFAMAVTVCMVVCDTWNYAYSRVMILEDVVREEYGGRYAFSREGSVIKAGPISEEAEVAWSKVESKSDFWMTYGYICRQNHYMTRYMSVMDIPMCQLYWCFLEQ